MEMVEKTRRDNVYPHDSTQCTDECKRRGCGHLWVTDGIWKTVFPHCMFRVEVSDDSTMIVILPPLGYCLQLLGRLHFHCVHAYNAVVM